MNFKSPDSLKKKFPDNYELFFTDQIASLDVGTVVYQVYALDTPNSSEV